MINTGDDRKNTNTGNYHFSFNAMDFLLGQKDLFSCKHCRTFYFGALDSQEFCTAKLLIGLYFKNKGPLLNKAFEITRDNTCTLVRPKFKTKRILPKMLAIRTLFKLWVVKNYLCLIITIITRALKKNISRAKSIQSIILNPLDEDLIVLIIKCC